MDTEENQKPNKINLSEVLESVGFIEKNDYYFYKLDELQVKARQVTDFGFYEVYYFSGAISREREYKELSFAIPEFVNSYEEGLALLSYYLKDNKLQKKTSWISHGLLLEKHLPWYKEREDFKNRPKLTIQSGWIRSTFKQIREIAEKSNEKDVTIFSFDGKYLKIVCNEINFQFYAIGNAWESDVKVYTKKLIFLPKRIPNYEISISFYKNSLNILYRSFEVVNTKIETDY